MKAEVDFKSTKRSYLFFFFGDVKQGRNGGGVASGGGRGVGWQAWEEAGDSNCLDNTSRGWRPFQLSQR